MIEPDHSLKESLFLCKPLIGLGDIASNCETMHDSTEEIDLILYTQFGEDFFRLMAFLGREDCVGFYEMWNEVYHVAVSI
jgi:hypothetical protein